MCARQAEISIPTKGEERLICSEWSALRDQDPAIVKFNFSGSRFDRESLIVVEARVRDQSAAALCKANQTDGLIGRALWRLPFIQ